MTSTVLTVLAAEESHALPLPLFVYPLAIGALLVLTLFVTLSWRDSGNKH